MSALISKLQDWYVRFLVWLGAEPPEGYEVFLPPAERRPSEYTLAEGETLYGVARRFGLHYETLAKANGIDDPATVKPGQTIAIPPVSWNPESDPPLAQPPADLPTLPEEQTEPDFTSGLIDDSDTEDAISPPPEFLLPDDEAPPVENEAAPPEEPISLWREETPSFDADESIDDLLRPTDLPPTEDVEPESHPVTPDTLQEMETDLPVDTSEVPTVKVEPVDRESGGEIVFSPPKEPIPIVEEEIEEISLSAETPTPVVEIDESSSEAISPIVDEATDIASPLESTVEDEEMLFRYEIQRGDTLNGIAKRYGVTVRDLIDVNNIKDPSRIYPGQKLIIPGYNREPEVEAPPEPEPLPKPRPEPDDVISHTVVRGDTLSGIAKRYGITLRRLIEANNIEDPNRLRVGQRLLIPDVIQAPSLESEPEPQLKPESQPELEPPPLPKSEPQPEPVTPPHTTPEPTVEIDPSFPPHGSLQATRGIYVSYFALGHADARQQIFNLLADTELNAVVMDVKGDHGLISYPTTNPTAQNIGANQPTAKDFGDILAQFKAHDIYTIARIVLFKDDPLAKAYPNLAVKRATNNGLWQDHEQSAWSDPFLKRVWDYNVQIAVEAAQLGFDEIQFDYLRFPHPSQAGEPHFSHEVSKETRIAALTGFLSLVRGQVQPFGVKLSAKTFGYTCWRKDDSLIGQDIGRLAPYLDVLSPMLAPSTFGSGIPGYKFAIAHPYEVVYESARRAVERIKRFNCAVRPWLQDFPDYRFDKRIYGREEIQAQIKGCFDAECQGFLVWSPRVQYTNQAYAPLKNVA